MESVKPVVEQEVVLALLHETFNAPIQDLAPVQGGLIAQTLSFRVEAQEYILRFTSDSMAATYQKESFIYRHFASAAIPIPPVLRVGRLGNLIFAISQKMPGRGLQSLSRAEYAQTLPSIMQTLYAIHQADVSAWGSYGWLDDRGTGLFPSWRRFLAHVYEEERPDGFYGRWHKLFETTFLERDFFEAVYERMLRLLELCPEERYLVHGGYGYNNVLAEDGRVTAVLDWIDAMYGDFVYDIAYIDFWREDSLAERFREYYASQGVPLAHYYERIACYQCYSGLDAMRFFAKTNDHTAYQATCRVLRKVLAACAGE